MPRSRSLHWHVGDAIFPNHQDAQQYAAAMARELRGETDANALLVYVTTIHDFVASQVKVTSCDQPCEY